MAAHRYWRILITEKGGDATFCNCSEIELRTSIGGADQTGSGTATASSTQGGFSPGGAVDNNTSSLWAFNVAANDSSPVWWKCDFGSGNDKDIVEVLLRSGAAGYQMWRTWALQWSDDDSSWTTLFSVGQDSAWSADESRTYSANAGPTVGAAGRQFWRIVSTASSGGTSFLGVAEIEMRTSIGGADQCSGGTAYSTNWLDGLPPSLAFDNNGTTLTVNGPAALPQWIGYRFASAKDIVEVAITARNDAFFSQAPKDFTIEYWDGSTYQVASTVTGSTGWAQGETRTFSFSLPSTARGEFFIFI